MHNHRYGEALVHTSVQYALCGHVAWPCRVAELCVAGLLGTADDRADPTFRSIPFSIETFHCQSGIDPRMGCRNTLVLWRNVGRRMNSTPHVKDHWYGHYRPDDKRYHIEHPFEHGRFEHFGPSCDRRHVARVRARSADCPSWEAVAECGPGWRAADSAPAPRRVAREPGVPEVMPKQPEKPTVVSFSSPRTD